jgi:hypothetical protein
MSGDKALRAAYQRGEDLHALTARKVLGIDDVSEVVTGRGGLNLWRLNALTVRAPAQKLSRNWT